MKVEFHPEFAKDIREFTAEYRRIYPALGKRFRREALDTIAVIKKGPQHAGHFIRTGSFTLQDYRRRNLQSFPFFVLYGWNDVRLIFGAVIASRSDPLKWLKRFELQEVA